jgi:hypothetical protein
MLDVRMAQNVLTKSLSVTYGQIVVTNQMKVNTTRGIYTFATILQALCTMRRSSSLLDMPMVTE